MTNSDAEKAESANAPLGQKVNPASLADLDEPVRRYFAHALTPGASVTHVMHLEMAGRINIRFWMPFHAEWERCR